MLLTTRDLCRIEELICKFPDFSDIYKEVFELRTRPEELIHMYSNVFLEADRNTERFMVDELKKKVAMKDAEISEKNAALSEKDTLIAELQKKLADANLL